MKVKSISLINLKYLLLVVCFSPVFLFAQKELQLDSLFGDHGKAIFSIAPGTSNVAQDKSSQIAEQSNGKIILAGYSNDIGGTDDWVITVIRVDATGELDSTFGVDGVSRIDFSSDDDEGWAVRVQSDDKIVVTGRIWEDWETGMGIVRLTKDGQLDSTFGENGKVLYKIGSKSDEGFDLVIQPDNKIIAVGRAWLEDGDTGWAVMRLLPSGELDSTFNTTGTFYYNSGYVDENLTEVILQEDGKILLGGSIKGDPAIIRLLPNGSFDSSFNSTGISRIEIKGQITSLALDSTGRIVYTAYSFNGLCKTGRLLPDGVTDDSFGDGGLVIFDTGQTSFYRSYDKVMILPDGNILGLGTFTSSDPFDDHRRLTLLLLSENGEILKSFESHPEMQFYTCFYRMWFVDAIFLNDGAIGITSRNCSMEKNYDMVVVKLKYDTILSSFEIVPMKKDFLVYPNPTAGELKIDNLDDYQSKQINIYDSLGHLLYSQVVDAFSMTIFLPEVDGVYYIQIAEVVKKVVKVSPD